ncbi:MAG: biopolymer transporter ExbD [Ferrovum sp.]|nr:biopolymer transporter ExbD [Ferrovum sp.]
MKYFETKRARIEIIPMIDIMFFLLVFFIMITLHMIPSTGVASNLAKSSTATALDPPKLLITVDDEGDITVEGQKLSDQALTQRLKSMDDPGKLVVTIAAETTTQFQSMMKVMDACREAGVTQIGLAARRMEK